MGDAVQTRLVAEQVAKATIKQFTMDHPELVKMEVPPPLKWAATIIAALFTMGAGGLCFWLITTVNEVQLTLARVDERLQNQTSAQGSRFDELDRRVSTIEVSISDKRNDK